MSEAAASAIPSERLVACSDGWLAVFVALPEEAGPLAQRLRRAASKRSADVSLPDPAGQAPDRLRTRCAYLGSRRVTLHVTGPGPGRAARAASQVLEGARPGAVICAGLCGGLDPALLRGDLVVAARVVDRDSGEVFDADSRLLEAARKTVSGHPIREAVLMTSSRVVGTAAEKAALHAEMAAAVDMESAAVARAAAGLGVPFLAVRIVSDAADENFPLDLNHYIDESGNVRRLQLAMAALGRPTAMPFLLRMRSAAKQGSGALASYLVSFFAALGRDWPAELPRPAVGKAESPADPSPSCEGNQTDSTRRSP